MCLKPFKKKLTMSKMAVAGSLGGSRENTPPYRSVSYPPNVSESENKSPVRSASWTSEVPVMPPLSVNVNLGPDMSGMYGELYR